MNPVEGYERLIAKLANSLYRPTRLYDVEDLIQIGLQVVVKVSGSYDEKIAKRSTFYTLCARREMLRFIKKHRHDFANCEYRGGVSYDPTPLWESLPDLCEVDQEIVNMITAGHKKAYIAKQFSMTVHMLQVKLERIGRMMSGDARE